VFYQVFPLGYFGAPPANDGTGAPVPRLARIREHYDHFKSLAGGLL
jgi:hypothetical protein